MRIACVVLHYNDPKSTLSCVESLLRLKIPKDTVFDIIVVDNDPENPFGLGKVHEELKVKVVKTEKNLGYSEGNNVGIRQALAEEADFVMILNNDTRVDENCLVELVKSLEKEGTGISVPKIYFEEGYEFHKKRYKKDELGRVIWYAGGIMDWDNLIGSHRGVDEVDRGQFNKVEPTEEATGCCMLVKAEVFRKIGLLDKNYYLYYEDADLSIRAKKAGYTIIYTPKAMVWHKNAESSSAGSTLQDYFITRNRMLFGMRYAPLRTKIALLREGLNLIRNGREWQKVGAKDFFKRNFGKGSWEV